MTAEVAVFGSWQLWGVVPHMHLHGTEIELTIVHADGGSTCAVDIPRWDFHWQQFYYYVNPLPGGPGDIVRLECTFDNTSGSRSLTLGRGHQRRDVPDVPLFHCAHPIWNPRPVCSRACNRRLR